MLVEDMAVKFFAVYRENKAHIPQELVRSLRVFIIGENHILRILDGSFEFSEYSGKYGYADISQLDRGKILNAFAKLEFLVNESINLYLLSTSSDKTEDLSFVVRKLPFRQRIEAIHEFGLINSSFEKKLKKLSSTRNTLAHEWSANSAKYDGKFLSDEDGLTKFQSSLNSVFGILIEKYRELQISSDYQNYLEKLILRIESSAHK